MEIHGWTSEGVAQVARMDAETYSLQTVHYKDSMVHAGNAFICTQKTAVDAFDVASPMTWHIVTPAASVATYHITLVGSSNDAGYIELFEDDGNTDHFSISGGTSYTPKNRNRSSSTAHGLTTCKYGVTLTNCTADCLVSVSVLGWSGSTDDFAMVLAPSTAYIIKATSYADNNEGSLQVNLFKNAA